MKLNRPNHVKLHKQTNVAKDFKIKNKRLLQKNKKQIQKKETVGGNYFDLHREKYL